MKKIKEFSCVAYKNTVQKSIAKKIRNMSYSEQIQFYQDQAQWFFQKKENVKKLK
jgi:hypothetical protein